jgi:hypothetical protein
MSHVSVLALEMVLESFHEHRTRYRASLVIFTHLRIFPPHLQPTHFPINTFSFVVQSTAFCTIVTSLNCLVTDKVSHNSKCSTCSTPQYKNLQKIQSFKKISKKNIQKSFKKTISLGSNQTYGTTISTFSSLFLAAHAIPKVTSFHVTLREWSFEVT